MILQKKNGKSATNLFVEMNGARSETIVHNTGDVYFRFNYIVLIFYCCQLLV